MAEDARPVAVTSGASEVRYVKVTETSGVDISGDVITACIAPLGTTPAPTDYAAPASTDFEVDDDDHHFVIVGVMVSSANAVAGQEYVVWAKVTDSPEVIGVAAPTSFPVV